MSKYTVTVFLVLICALSQASDSLESHSNKNSFSMDVDVNIVGVEAATKELSNAMQQVAQSINRALQSDKLSPQERQKLLDTLNSFKGIKEKFSVSLEDARAPIKNILSDASEQVSESVKKTVDELNESIVEPLAFKFQLIFYILISVVVLLVLGIIVFIKVYILSALNRASTSAQNLVATLDALPTTVETIMTNVENAKIKSNEPRFVRNTNKKIKSPDQQ